MVVVEAVLVGASCVVLSKRGKDRQVKMVSTYVARFDRHRKSRFDRR